MPGIYGYIKSKKIEAGSLDVMANVMHLYPHFIQDKLFEDDNIAVSRTHIGGMGEKDTPIVKQDIFLWVEGEAYNVDEVCDDLGLDRGTFSESFLAAYDSNILERFLNKVDGFYCAVLYDATKKKIKLVSDRYGMRMLYFYVKNGVFIWASEVKGILVIAGVDKTLNPNSLPCFMALGYLLATETHFKNIQLISPATIIDYDLVTEERTSHYYWKWSEITPNAMSFEQAVDELGRKFIKAVERRFTPQENIGVALSGGLDSRAILAAVNELYPKFKGYCYTFGLTDCDDITIADQVAKLTGWKHQTFNLNHYSWFTPRIKKIRDTDGMLDMMHMHGSEFCSDVSKKMQINLNGYAGDLVLGGGFLNSIELNQRADIKNIKGFYKEFVHLIDVEDDFYNLSKVEPILYMNRVRRFTGGGVVNALPFIQQRMPFFDNDIVELIFSLPDEYRKDNKLYAAMLKKFFPSLFNKVVWQKTGKVIGASTYRTLLVRIMDLLKRKACKIMNKRSTQEYVDYPNWIRETGTATFLKDLLGNDQALYRALTKDDFYKKYLIPHLKSKYVNYSNEILRAATFELYLREINELPMQATTDRALK